MRFKQLNIETNYLFWIEPIDNKELVFVPGDLGQLRISPRTGKLQLTIKGKLFTITPRKSSILNDIALDFSRGNANLVEINRVHQQKDWPPGQIQLELALVIFNGPEIELGSIEVALDNRTEKQAQELGFGSNLNEIKSSLEKFCTLSFTDGSNEQYAIAVLGEEALDQLNKIQKSENIPKTQGHLSKNEDGMVDDEIFQQKIKSGFILLGDDLQLAIQQYSAGDFDYLGVRKLVARYSTAPTRTLRLVKLQLSFSSQSQQLAPLINHQLSKIINDQKGYLSTWDRYGQSEGEQLLKRARSIGRIEVSPENFEIIGEAGNQLSISIDRDLRDLLTTQDSLQMMSPDVSIPYLEDKEMGWQEFSAQMLEEYRIQKGFQSSLSDWETKISEKDLKTNDDQEQLKQAEGSLSQILKVIKVEQNRIIVEGATIPSGKMAIVQSIMGDQVQIERQMAARNAIVEGKSAMPHLGLIIEEGAVLPEGRSQRPKLKALSSFVENKIFPNHPPTATQKEAIKIALNTPDIVIIQGPPGTGKTTVITAIIERLNQEQDKNKSIQGDILVSGYQHDAVENLLSRLSVNDLPAIKFGRRSGETEQSSSMDIKLDKWRLDTVRKIYQHEPKLKESIAYLQLEHDLIAYVTNPGDRAAYYLVSKAKALLTGVPGSETLLDLLQNLQRELDSHQNLNSDGIQFLRALRLSKSAFMDDGSDRAAALLVWLDEQEIKIEEKYLKVLRQASVGRLTDSSEFLQQLKEVKQQLLKQFMPRPQLKRALAREDVKVLIERTLEYLKNNSRQEAKNRALIDYLHDLEGNPFLVQEALSEYNLVYGATTGQSEGEHIRRFKSKSGDGKGYLQYSTVIVDEAARASPRDLMIPMVQAKDRIILVGDHRQLPHIVDEALLEQLKSAAEGEDGQEWEKQINEHITASMFQYLFNRAKQLEQQDGIPRTITLDAQYRSHPLLGQFASEQFYAPYGEGYQSPLPDTLFTHQLEGIENKAAIWIDAPARLGDEGRNSSKSRYRKAEATLIAKQLKLWIDSEPGKSLSFGVISFYKAQVDEVMRALSKYQITELDEEGNYRVTKEYQMLYDKTGDPIEERLRIGTVDSFQGMEFDVVFLSMVRSQQSNSLFLKDREFSVAEQQKVFGHLMSKNRLCVSVTRQKKVLVLVGDAQLVQMPIAKQAIPELSAFYDLCKEHPQGAVLI